MKKKLAVIGAGFLGKIIIEQAKEMGVETHCFAWEKGAVARDAADFFYPVSVTEREEILRLCREIGIDGIIGSASITLGTAAYIADRMGLNGNPPEIAEVVNDKYRNRILTRGIPGLHEVRFKKVTDIDELEDMPYPLILKPVSAGGKAGLSVARTREELEIAFRYAEDSGYKEFIAEEFIEGGKEYSVESLSFHGKNYIIQVTDKVSGGPPHCVELSHHQPATLPADMRTKVETTVDRILSAVGILNGPCHTEIKIVEGSIYLVEVNGRLAGGHISYPLVDLSTGYPYIKGVIKTALDCLEDIDTGKFRHHYSSVFFVTEQTQYLKPVFDVCENYSWCYKKQEVSKELKPLIKNDGYRINYFIYYSPDTSPAFLLK